PTLERLQRLHAEDVAISLVTIGEIYEGAYLFTNPDQYLTIFRQFLRSFPVLTLNDPILEQFAAIRSRLRRRGEIISDFDILLGATALHHDLMVLTYNVRHLKRIPHLKLYQEA